MPTQDEMLEIRRQLSNMRMQIMCGRKLTISEQITLQWCLSEAVSIVNALAFRELHQLPEQQFTFPTE